MATKKKTSVAKKSRTMSNSNIVFKIIIVGDTGVGKSCLLVRYTRDEFSNEYNATIGVEFSSKQVQIDENTKIKLQIWDTAGQESFKSIVRSFYRNSSAVMLVYNLTDKNSFANVQQWYNEAKSNALEDAVFVLVGAQKDRESERQVSYEEGKQFMTDKKFNLFFETSSKDGSNIDIAFKETAKLVFLNNINKRLEKAQQYNKEHQSKEKQLDEQLDDNQQQQLKAQQEVSKDLLFNTENSKKLQTTTTQPPVQQKKCC